MFRPLRNLSRHPLTGFILVVVGVFCLTLAPLVPWYVLPRLEQTPENIDTTNETIATGRVFDGTGLKGPIQFTISTTLVGRVDAGQPPGVAVWDLSTQVDTPDTVNLHDPRYAMSWLTERLVFDRHTNEPVHCCGETPVHQGNAFLKFPFNVAQGTYQYWNPQVRKAFPVSYAGSVTLEGHTLYRFTGTVPPTKSGTLDLPGSLIGLPQEPGMVHTDEYYADTGDVLLIDPLSGSPVSVTQHPVTTVRLPGGTKDLLTLSTLTVAPTADSVHTLLQQAISGDSELTLIQSDAPIGLLVLGFVVTVLGVVQLILGQRRARRAPSPGQAELAGVAS